MIESTRDFFDTLAKVLVRCWIFGFVLLLLWLAALLTGIIHKLQGPMMGLSHNELDVIHYSWMAFLKLLVLVLFFIPWLSIKLVLKKKKD